MKKKIAKGQTRGIGLLYFVLAVGGIFTLVYVPAQIFVSGDHEATVANVMASELIFRAGIVSGLFSSVLHVVLALVLYRLLRFVSEAQAKLMVVFVVIGSATTFANSFNQLAVLVMLHGADFLAAFEKSQVDSLIYLFLQLSRNALQIAQIFWGLWLFPFGFLVYRSGFIPKTLGVLLVVAGIGYLASSFVFLLLPQYKIILAPLMAVLEAAELPIIFWLMIVGVRPSYEMRHTEP